MKITSKQPRKQRKALFNPKNHQKSKLLSTRLADFLTDEYGIKKLPLRVGDSIRVCKGEFKDFEGEVIEVLPKKQRVKIKEAAFERSDGTQFHPAIHVSNVIITKFRKEGKRMDGWRALMIERKASFRMYGDELLAPKKEKAKGQKKEEEE